MLPFEFERTLFKFKANKPAFEPLFQLPPDNGIRIQLFPNIIFYFSMDCIQPPNILPTSSIARDNRS